MTQSQAAAKIRENLNDLGITYYSATDLADSIQDAYDEVVVYTECLEKSTTIPFAANTTYYDIPTLVPDYYRPISLYHNGQNRFIEPSSDRLEYMGRSDWELISAEARQFIILGPKYLGLSGRSSVANSNFKLYYKATAPILTESSQILINPVYIELIENYGTADLLEQNEEYTKASKYWEQYYPMLEAYREKIQILARADRVFTRF